MAPHGSLEVVGDVITSEVCHSKANISVITETQLFGKFINALFSKIILVKKKIVTFSTLLALLATVWRKHRQIVC